MLNEWGGDREPSCNVCSTGKARIGCKRALCGKKNFVRIWAIVGGGKRGHLERQASIDRRNHVL